MNALTYADALKELANPRPEGDLKKQAIGRAAQLAGLTYTRARDIWYDKARRIDAHEAAQITDAIEKRREDNARNEIHDLRTRLLMVESRIAAEASNSTRPRLSHRRPSHAGGGGMDRSLARVK